MLGDKARELYIISKGDVIVTTCPHPSLEETAQVAQPGRSDFMSSFNAEEPEMTFEYIAQRDPRATVRQTRPRLP